MARPTRDRIVDAAMRLFAEKGYSSTSIADILGRAGVNAGSLYYFFPAKQHILLAVLDAYHGGIDRMLLAPAWKGVTDPIARIFALLDAYRGMLHATDCTYGCPIGSIALELHEPDPAVRERLAANFRAWVAAIERCLQNAGDRLPSGTDRHAVAVFVLTTMEGGVMLSRTERSLEPYDAAVRALSDYMAVLQAGTGKSSRRKDRKR
jgi:TetR/AcrR family transcriptional regulator, transcriptional repressor for nem operon